MDESTSPPLPSLSHDQVALVPENKPVSGFTLINARSDAEAVALWINRFLLPGYSKHTAINARKEAERFLFWIQRRGLSFSRVLLDHCIEYRQFLVDPPRDFVGKRTARFLRNGMPNPEWRPFNGPLSASSESQAVRILRSMFEFLCSVGYLERNPWRYAVAPTEKKKNPAVEHYLDVETWKWLLKFIEKEYAETTRGRHAHARIRWIFRLFYLTGARLSEVTGAHMSDITQTRGRWWLHVIGKGQKEADIPLTLQCMKELSDYREWANLSPLPSSFEKSVPLVCDGYGAGRPASSNTVYKLIREVCKDAAKAAPPGPIQDQITCMSTHWLRHTSASHKVNESKISVDNVSRLLRHNDIKTTMLYLHKEKDDLHDAASLHTIDDDE